MKLTKIFSIFALIIVLNACNAKLEPADPNPSPHDAAKGEGVFSKDGDIFSSFKGFSKSNSNKLGVNAYLWKSSIEAVSFMPLVQADSNGGVIISDWVDQGSDKNSQVKVTVYILTQKLEANGIMVKVFSRTRTENGQWENQKLDKATSLALEDTILSNARTAKIKDHAK